jgi:hypothetical protein
MTIDDLKKVNKICAHMQAFGGMDYRTAYSFALVVVQNKKYLKEVLTEGSENHEQIQADH